MSKTKGQVLTTISGIQAVKSRSAIENFKTDGIRPHEILRILFAIVFAYLPISVSISALRMTYPIYYLIFPTLVIVGVYFLVGKIEKGFLRFLLQIALIGLYTYRNYKDIIEGAKCVAERFINVITKDENALLELYTKTNTKSVEITLVTTVYMIVFIVLFLATVDIFNLAIHILFTVPFYILPYIMRVEYEPYVPIVMVVHGILMFVMFFADEKMLEINQEPTNAYNIKGTKAITVRVAMWSMLITAIVATALIFAEPESEYKEDSIFEYVEQKIIQISSDIKNLTMNIGNGGSGGSSGGLGGNGGGSNGLGGNYLGQTDKQNLSNKEKVKVILNQKSTGDMYIRLNTYGRYLWEKEGKKVLNRWADTQSFSDKCGTDAIEAVNRIAAKALDEMFLPTVKKYNYDIYYKCDDLETGLPVPYFSNHNMVAARDYVVLPGVLNLEYRIESKVHYLPADETSLHTYKEISHYVKKYKIYEKERLTYEKYINEEYLQVPKELTRFHDEFGDMEFDSLESCIIFIKQYLSEYQYTLEPGKYEEGNFLEDFLFDRKKGYCSYFATAATLMLREFGFPARYVEGYMISATDYEKIGNSYKYVATGRDAHAWCEVYISGAGWVPFEVTVGRGFGEEETENKDTQEITTEENVTVEETTEEWTTQEETTEITTTIKNQETTNGGEENSSEEGTTTAPDETEEETTEETTTATDDSDEKKGWDIDDETFETLNYIFVGLVVFLLLLTRVIGYHRKKNRFTKMLTSSDYRDKANAVREIFDDFVKIEKIVLPYYEMRKKHCERMVNKYPELSYKSLMNIIKVVDMSVYAGTIKDEKSVDIAIEELKYVILKVYGKKNIVYKCILRYIKCLYLFTK